MARGARAVARRAVRTSRRVFRVGNAFNPVFLLVGLLAAVAEPLPIAAHGGRVPLSDWGAFDPPTARCQRTLLVATQRCARNAWEIRRKCRAAQYAGESCDEARTDAAVVAVRRAALDLVDVHCNERQLAELGFLGQFDVQTDVISACRSWEDLMESAVFAVAVGSGAACVRKAERALTGAAGRLFDRWSRSLRFLATHPATPEQKEVRVGGDEARAATLAARLVAELHPSCGNDATRRLSRITDLAVCVPASISVQERVICPEPICGNGLVEPGEIDDACPSE